MICNVCGSKMKRYKTNLTVEKELEEELFNIGVQVNMSQCPNKECNNREMTQSERERVMKVVDEAIEDIRKGGVK